MADVVEGKFEEVKPQIEQPKENVQEIKVDNATAFNLRVQQFDRDIAIAEAQIADLKKQKMCFIYDTNVQLIVEQSKVNAIKSHIEEETKKKLAVADIRQS